MEPAAVFLDLLGPLQHASPIGRAIDLHRAPKLCYGIGAPVVCGLGTPAVVIALLPAFVGCVYKIRQPPVLASVSGPC